MLNGFLYISTSISQYHVTSLIFISLYLYHVQWFFLSSPIYIPYYHILLFFSQLTNTSLHVSRQGGWLLHPLDYYSLFTSLWETISVTDERACIVELESKAIYSRSTIASPILSPILNFSLQTMSTVSSIVPRSLFHTLVEDNLKEYEG